MIRGAFDTCGSPEWPSCHRDHLPHDASFSMGGVHDRVCDGRSIDQQQR